MRMMDEDNPIAHLSHRTWDMVILIVKQEAYDLAIIYLPFRQERRLSKWGTV